MPLFQHFQHIFTTLWRSHPSFWRIYSFIWKFSLMHLFLGKRHWTMRVIGMRFVCRLDVIGIHSERKKCLWLCFTYFESYIWPSFLLMSNLTGSRWVAWKIVLCLCFSGTCWCDRAERWQRNKGSNGEYFDPDKALQNSVMNIFEVKLVSFPQGSPGFPGLPGGVGPPGPLVSSL